MLLLSANSGTETHGQMSCLALVCLFQTSSRIEATANGFFFLALEKNVGILLIILRFVQHLFHLS